MTFEEASTGVGVEIFTWIYTFVQLIGDILKWKFQISKATQKLNFLKVLRFSFPVPVQKTSKISRSRFALEKNFKVDLSPRAQGFFFLPHSKPTKADVFPVFALAENTSAFSGYPLPFSKPLV